MCNILEDKNPYEERFEVNDKPRKPVSLVYCEHCETEVTPSVYSRNHGDKCPYKDALLGCKICKTCGESVELKDFYRSSAKTFDGLACVCRFCLLEKIREKRDEIREKRDMMS